MSKTRCMGCMQEYDDGVNVCPYCGYVKGTPVKEKYHLIPGTVLKNRYLVGQSIGFGGFGITYIGWDKLLEKKVAIKEYLPSEFATRMEGTTVVSAYDGEKTKQYESGLTRFIDEAQRLAKLNHLDGIVHIFDSFSENCTAYIVMEYLSGETLKSILKTRDKLSYQEAIDIAIPLLNSLEEVHKKGIIHRDIAPDNIMITDDGRVKLIDFGAARYATTVHSKSLSVVLKPGYAPEEQYRSHGNQGPWTDVYAMGATLYRAITGIIPEESLNRKFQDKLKDISEFVPNIPKACENAIMNALNVRAEDRIQTAKEFADVLSGVSEMERKRIKTKQADAGKWSLKMKIIAVSVVVVCIAVIGVVLFNNTTIKNMVFNSNSIELYGKTVDEANKELESVNKSVKIYDSLYDDGSLLSQLAENSIVKSDDITDDKSVINVIVYAGKKASTKADINNNVRVPNLYGMKESKAISTLKEYGLKYKIVYKENNSFVGNVFQQSKKANDKVKVNSEVTITVGKKKKVVVTTTAPTTEPYTEPVTENNNSYNDNSSSYNQPVTQAPATQAQQAPVRSYNTTPKVTPKNNDDDGIDLGGGGNIDLN